MSQLALRASMLPPTVRVSETSIELDDGLAYEDWADIGMRLGRAARASGWWVGDWLNYGVQAGYISSETYDRAVEITGLARKTLQDYSYVARTYPSSIRIEELSFKHHQVVAGRLDEERTSLLEATRENSWSTRELAEHIQHRPDFEPYVPQNQHQRDIATAAARRLSKTLGSVHGFCAGIEDFKLPRAIAGATREELELWYGTCREAKSALDSLARDIKEAMGSETEV